MGTPSDDSAGKTFAPPSPGRAALYVYQGQGNVVLDITVNQRVLGRLGEFTYLRTEVPPGRYDVRAKVNNVDAAVLALDVRAGEIRYIRATAAPQTYTLREEPASVGQPAVLAAKRISEIKFLEVPY
jgi:hypothetical protein